MDLTATHALCGSNSRDVVIPDETMEPVTGGPRLCETIRSPRVMTQLNRKVAIGQRAINVRRDKKTNAITIYKKYPPRSIKSCATKVRMQVTCRSRGVPSSLISFTSVLALGGLSCLLLLRMVDG
jgi:hypothetical protein